MRSDSDRDRTVRTGNAIFYSIFNKRLKDQAWNAGAHQFGRNIYAGDEAIRKPDGLDIQIELLQANLVRQRHIVQRIAGQAGAIEIGQAHDHRLGLFRSGERRVGKEGVSTCNSWWWPYMYKQKISSKQQIV